MATPRYALDNAAPQTEQRSDHRLALPGDRRRWWVDRRVAGRTCRNHRTRHRDRHRPEPVHGTAVQCGKHPPRHRRRPTARPRFRPHPRPAGTRAPPRPGRRTAQTGRGTPARWLAGDRGLRSAAHPDPHRRQQRRRTTHQQGRRTGQRRSSSDVRDGSPGVDGTCRTGGGGVACPCPRGWRHPYG